MKEDITILMVDDEERFRNTTKKILGKRGFQTILAANGQEALDKISQNPDVVILDINMPGMNGHETLSRIRETHPDMPVIMLTGHGGQPSAEKALDQGAFDYLSKPCDMDLLAEKIREACTRKQNITDRGENSLESVMIPMMAYTVLREDHTVAQAIDALKQSWHKSLATNQIMETRHRSILITDQKDNIQGILTVNNLMEAIMPRYLQAPKPSLADSIEYSPMFWNGMFCSQVQEVGKMAVSDVMSPSPPTIDIDSNLMETAFVMVSTGHRRLIVTRSDTPVGVVREQDLFFEMERVLSQ